MSALDQLEVYRQTRAANAGQPDQGHAWAFYPLDSLVTGQPVAAIARCCKCTVFRRSNGENRPCVGKVLVRGGQRG